MRYHMVMITHIRDQKEVYRYTFESKKAEEAITFFQNETNYYKHLLPLSVDYVHVEMYLTTGETKRQSFKTHATMVA